jgi:hypothetical protein
MVVDRSLLDSCEYLLEFCHHLNARFPLVIVTAETVGSGHATNTLLSDQPAESKKYLNVVEVSALEKIIVWTLAEFPIFESIHQLVKRPFYLWVAQIKEPHIA